MPFVTQKFIPTLRQNRKRSLPRSFESQVGFVLRLDPVKAGTLDAVDSEVANELHFDNVILRSLSINHNHTQNLLAKIRGYRNSMLINASVSLKLKTR